MPGRPFFGGSAAAWRACCSVSYAGAGRPGSLSGPPGTERVVEQELHHVVLCEELGDGGEFAGADLDPGSVDLVLALGLPELVGPAERVVGAEGLGGHLLEQPSQLDLVVGGEPQVQHRVVLAEDAGQGLGGEAAGEVEAVAGVPVGIEFRGQFGALLQGDGKAAVLGAGVQQVVLGQEAGEEQPAPVLVGGGLGELVDGLGTVRVQPVAQRPSAGAQTVAQAPRGPRSRPPRAP